MCMVVETHSNEDPNHSTRLLDIYQLLSERYKIKYATMARVPPCVWCRDLVDYNSQLQLP